MTTITASPLSAPGTIKEAKAWQATRDGLAGAGVCYPDAVRLAYGVQHGFADIAHRVCSSCIALMHTKRIPMWLLQLRDLTGLQWFSVMPMLEEKTGNKRCVECGKLFEAKRFSAKYCSGTCRERVRRRRLRRVSVTSTNR